MFLEKRLQGLVLPMMKKDCVDLPDKQHREIRCKPTRSTMRVAEALIDLAPTAIQALTWLRELSDGFQYTDKQVGEKPCECTYPSEDWPAVRSPDPDCHICEGTGLVPIMERQARMVPTPKDQVVKDLLEECDEQGRIVIFAGFRGSIDRVQALCLNQGWDVVRVDGRGWRIFGENITKEYCRENSALDHWISSARRVVFLAHPKSGGLGLTLTESRMAVFYSNDFDPESRSQASDRIHRMGMDLNLGATIVDIFHLPVDEHVRNILRDNRKLELLTLGEVQDALAELEKSYV